MVSLIFRKHTIKILSTDPDPDVGDSFSLVILDSEPCLFTVGLDTSGSQKGKSFEVFSERAKVIIDRPFITLDPIVEGQRAIVSNEDGEVVGIYQITSILPSYSNFILLLGKDSGEF